MNALVPLRAPIEGEVLAPGDDACTIVFQRSPFSTRTETLHVPAGTSIAEAVERVGIAPRFRGRASAFLAEHSIDPALWPKVRIRPGAVLYIRLTPGWNYVVVAFQWIATWAAAFFNSPAGQYLINMGVNVAITAAVSYLYRQLNPPPEQNDKWSFDQQAGNPYGQITGIANRESRYGPIARVLGKRRLYPMIAARSFTEMQGNTQFLRMLLLVGYGPLKITDIKIGDTPIASYVGATVQIREGWPDDVPQTLYTKIIDEDRFQITLSPSVANTRSTALDTTEVSLDITFPAGLAHIKDDGRIVNRTVHFSVEYSSDGGMNWNNAVWLAPKGNEYGTQTNGVIEGHAATTRTFVRSGRFTVPSGQHLVRVIRTTAAGSSNQIDTAIWTVLRSIKQDSPLNMVGLSTISLRLQATEQLNGVPNTISCIAESYLPVYDSNTGSWEWSLAAASNPAWQYVDVLNQQERRRRALELRQACFHEAAHCIVARSLGATLSHAVVVHLGDAGTLGRTYAVGPQGEAVVFSPSGQRLFGLAGFIGEAIAEGYDLPREIAEAIEALSPSQADLGAAGLRTMADCPPADLAAVLQAVRDLWPEIEAEANDIMRRRGAPCPRAERAHALAIARGFALPPPAEALTVSELLELSQQRDKLMMVRR